MFKAGDKIKRIKGISNIAGFEFKREAIYTVTKVTGTHVYIDQSVRHWQGPWEADNFILASSRPDRNLPIWW